MPKPHAHTTEASHYTSEASAALKAERAARDAAEVRILHACVRGGTVFFFPLCSAHVSVCQ
jgi:gamma-glutamyl-gamma-aminobutyrate hydrolase PuuD